MTEMTSADRILSVINMEKPTKDELAHHGVVGMKWGVRKARPVSKGSKTTPSKKASKKAAKAKETRTKVPNTFKNKPGNRRLSDRELTNKINRIRLEQQYAQLTAKPKSRTKTFMKELMINSGQRAATTIANKAVDAMVQRTLSSAAANATGGAKEVLTLMANGTGKKKDK